MTNEADSPLFNGWLDHESLGVVEEINRCAGWNAEFPRDVEEIFPIVLPVMIVPSPNLSPSSANHWFLSRGREQRFNVENRPLHGCFLGHREIGFIFVDSNDSPDERRFTIAHEIAHFYLDHLIPRRRAIARFGPAIREVMDEYRRPTIAESFKSILEAIPIGQHIDLMERKSGGEGAMQMYVAEERADRVALALLAPPDVVLQKAGAESRDLDALTDLLVTPFGLPPAVAAGYADSLLRGRRAHSSPYDKLVRA